MRGNRTTDAAFPPVHFRLVLIAAFLFLGLLPFFLKGLVLTRSFSRGILENRQQEIQNQSRILATKLSRAGYLKNPESRDAALNTEMDTAATIYDGRIVLVDENYRIIRDSFHLSEGRFHMAPEVIRGFRGENGSSYNRELGYLVQVSPVYSSASSVAGAGSDRTVDGVLLFIASTERLGEELRETTGTHLFFDAITILVLLLLSLVLSSVLTRPFDELRDAVAAVSYGSLDREVRQNSYRVTSEISAAVNTTMRKLKAADQSRDEFVSNVSHELKTPITSIRVLADSLMSMEEVPPELYRDFMNDISGEIDREAKIIDDLLSLVKLDRAAGGLNRKATDIHAMLEQILKRLRPIARLNNIDLTLETVREVTADVDEVKFSLAITNLVENAIKYNVKDGWVHVNLDADHQFCYIRVDDSGIGIPESETESVFERFYRVDKARSRESGGTGLGLAITKELVLLHQGMIRLTSREGEGSSFLVRIPLNHIENTSPQALQRTQEKQVDGISAEKEEKEKEGI